MNSDDPTADTSGSTRSDQDLPVDPLVGETISGRYRVLGSIGEGGFGRVYEAEQFTPVTRRVALKVLKPGMDSKEVLARFEAERQALALMNHPCVAKILDAGETDRGLPFFVMELVRGAPITEYCDRQRLTIRQRLELFMLVCDAIQHAHTKAIIHRDIKPSNVLVEVREGGEPRPKVIDFGIAKAMSQKLTARTLFTERGQLIGTPEYMSPEQAEMAGEDIDTRSDVYSLGVLLYELLAGERPFDLRKAALAEIQRVIREHEPPKPSTRLTIQQVTATRVAACRRTDLKTLSGTLKRELEWIPLKALRKDRTERYLTAANLAEDVRRYMASEPLEAGPPSIKYRLGKAIQRHRFPVAAAIAVLGVSVLLFGLQARALYTDYTTGNARFTALAHANFLLGLSVAKFDSLAEHPPTTAAQARSDVRIQELLELRQSFARDAFPAGLEIESQDAAIARLFWQPEPAWIERMGEQYSFSGNPSAGGIPDHEYTILIESWTAEDWRARFEGVRSIAAEQVKWARWNFRSEQWESWAYWADRKPRVFVNDAEAQEILVRLLGGRYLPAQVEYGSWVVREPAPELTGTSDNLFDWIQSLGTKDLRLADSVSLTHQLEQLAYPSGDQAWITRWWWFALPTAMALISIAIAQFGLGTHAIRFAYLMATIGLLLLTYHCTKLLLLKASALSGLSWFIVWVVGLVAAVGSDQLVARRHLVAPMLAVALGVSLAVTRPIWVNWAIYYWAWDLVGSMP